MLSAKVNVMPWNDQSGSGRKGNSGRGPRGRRTSGADPSDLEKLLKRGQDKFRQVVPSGSGLPGSVTFLVMTVLASVVGYHAFTFRVNPDELGVVIRFGKVVRQKPPGLHFRMPYPIDEVRLPKVTRQNIIQIGMRSSEAARGERPVPEESLMLTGDENIVDIHFVVYWRIK